MNLNKIILTSLAAIITATAAFAAGENIVASKKYTDDTFQTKISATDDSGGELLHVLTDSDTDGVVGKMALTTFSIMNGDSLGAWAPDDAEIPTFKVVNEYMQSKIPTGNVLLKDNDGDGVYDASDFDFQVPGLVAYDPTTGTLNGTKIGILDYETILEDEGGLSVYTDGNYENGEMDNFVPTVRAVAEGLQNILNVKQNKIPKSGYIWVGGDATYNTNAANVYGSWLNANVKGTGLVTKTATDGQIGERKIFESTDVANYHAANLNQNEKDIQDISIPTVGAMMTAMQKQIPAGNVLVRDEDGDGVYDVGDGDVQVPGLVAYDSTTGGLSGTKIGIADYNFVENEMFDDGWNNYIDDPRADRVVPTIGAVAKELRRVTIPKSGYNSLYGTSAYNTNAANNWNSWLSLGVKGTGLVTRTANDGEIGERKIFESTDVANYHAAALSQNEKDIQDISIPTVGAMMAALTNGTEKITWSATQTAAVNNYSTTFDGTANNWVATDSGKLVDGSVIANAVALKQNIIPANNATTYPNGSVVTYGATAGTPGQVAIASAATYNQQTGALENGTQIANIAAVDTRQKKKVCAGWPDSVAVADRSDANCWLWYFPD